MHILSRFLYFLDVLAASKKTKDSWEKNDIS